MTMTLRRFTAMLGEIETLVKMESGDEVKKETAVTGKQAMTLGKQIFPRGRGWQK